VAVWELVMVAMGFVAAIIMVVGDVDGELVVVEGLGSVLLLGLVGNDCGRSFIIDWRVRIREFHLALLLSSLLQITARSISCWMPWWLMSGLFSCIGLATGFATVANVLEGINAEKWLFG